MADQASARFPGSQQAGGTPRDIALIIAMLYTGLRAAAVCSLRRRDVTINGRSGVVPVYGKRNKIARYAHLARVADVSPHDLRHRFGYRMAESTPLHRWKRNRFESCSAIGPWYT